MNGQFDEMLKLNELLTQANIPHTLAALYDGMQIRLFADTAFEHELDDCVIHSGSHGHANGLLETYTLGGCEGWETAEDVFNGWMEMHRKANQPKTNHCTCSIIGASGEIWKGSAPSWD